jgi:translation initiation factor 2B subunit (eIF-2B alpha/beta/delta family)
MQIMDKKKQIAELIQPISEDLLSGAAEIALKAIFIYQTVINLEPDSDLVTLQADLAQTARALVNCQPAMAPLFHLSNHVLFATQQAANPAELRKSCQKALDDFERGLCESVGKIAELVYDLIPPGELVFAYSFSSTVVSCLLNARARGRYFRVACSESRPSMEGRKLAARLAAGGIEIIHTFDSAMGIVLPTCSVAFMGCDCIGIPGLVNKVGSLLLGLSCQEMGIPLYALCGTEKFVTDERLFEFENHERPGNEVWSDPPSGVKVVNRQFELIPTKLLTGLVTEVGILKEQDFSEYLSKVPVHEALRLEPAGF